MDRSPTRYTAPCDVVIALGGIQGPQDFTCKSVQLFFFELNDGVCPQLVLCGYNLTGDEWALFCSNLTPILSVRVQEL
ncbi:hypothetical protein BV20DRAFT_953028, partial [Pilatotrama ljubarskyi]